MKPDAYILEKLQALADVKPVLLKSTNELVEHIYTSLMSKKFRKYAVTPQYQTHIKNVIQQSIVNKEPIKLTFVFGGYKLWRLPESPEVDWAELFALMYYTKWLLPILSAYKPGVWFDFYSDDIIIERMNNVPKTQTIQYKQSFMALLHFIQPYIPKNIRFTFNRVGDQYETEELFEKELNATITKLTIDRNKTPLKLTAQHIAAIEMNVQVLPNQKKDPQWKDKIQIIHDAYALSSKRRPYYRNTEKIMVVNIPIKDSLAVGTTKSSVVKFWIGSGALVRKGDAFQETILSPKQITEMKYNTSPVAIPGLSGKNFTSIKIVD